jgi:hypothetical protein
MCDWTMNFQAIKIARRDVYISGDDQDEMFSFIESVDQTASALV